MYPVIALIALTLLVWFIAFWATFEEDDEAGSRPEPEAQPCEDVKKVA